MYKNDFSFELPKELVALHPAPVRSESRLLIVPDKKPSADGVFRDVVSLLKPEDLLVFNDSRVIRARFCARKETEGKVEVLLERIVSPVQATAYLGFNRKLKLPVTLRAGRAGQWKIRVTTRTDDCFSLELDPPDNWDALLSDIGEVPLPPYLHREAEAADAERYQTVYARVDGSVAAPTAGLHFDKPLLEAVKAKGVRTANLTLHIGGGTFQPLRTADLSEHKMHSERIVIDADLCEAVRDCRARSGRVVAVGTTVLRALESVAADGDLSPCERETDIFIQPGWDFRAVDVLITNFHLPETTLFVLVCAFAGRERMLDEYRHAMEQKYRFFSYGDAMWLERAFLK